MHSSSAAGGAGGIDDNKKEEEKDVKIICTSVTSTSSESLSCTPAVRESEKRVRTWGNDDIAAKKSRWDWQWHSKARWKVRWSWVFADAWRSFWHGLQWMSKEIRHAALWKRVRWSKKQVYAACLVVIGVVIPMTMISYLTPFNRIFADKTLSCGDNFVGQPQNATVKGIEKLFALDATFGRFSFSQAKTIDILWDLLVGRGAQALAWWASYNVFCDALLRAIERHPASFEMFQRLAMEGPGLHALWTLTKELWTAKSARTRALFFYMFVSTGYVLLVPIVLGAMTGYDSTSIAWIDLEGENNIIPASMLQQTWVIIGTKNETFKEPACADIQLRNDYIYVESSRRNECDCRWPNGTMSTPTQRNELYYSNWYYDTYDALFANCSFTYPNNTQIWNNEYDWHVTVSPVSLDHTYQCNATIPVTVNEKTYDAYDLVTDYGYCYDNVGYNNTYLENKSRCLPDTANPSYGWGFATLMSGLFIFVTAVWTLSMYVLWQDAQFNCTLVKQGYRLTPLRAAFAMAVAARRRTGLGGRALVREKMGALERELYGKKGTVGTKIEGYLFMENPEEGEEQDGVVRTPVSPLSPVTPAFVPGVREREKRWPVCPAGVPPEYEVRSLVRSDTDISFHVLDDEELRKRYLRGVEEARLSRKPLSREATLVGESVWEGGKGGDGDDDGHKGDEDDGIKAGSDTEKRKSRNRLKKNSRPG